MFPALSFAFSNNIAFKTIFHFLPTRVLMGIVEWQWFDLAYLFGNAIPLQFIIIATAILILAVSVFISFTAFKRHQVEN